MKHLCLALTLLLAVPLAQATDMPDLAKKNRCTDCHAMEKKIIGPAWQDVSLKYRGHPEVLEPLIAKVSKGGVGVWGDMPMPANDPGGRKYDDIKALVQFILGLSN